MNIVVFTHIDVTDIYTTLHYVLARLYPRDIVSHPTRFVPLSTRVPNSTLENYIDSSITICYVLDTYFYILKR